MNKRKFFPFDPKANVRIRWRNLPHWEQDACSYFVTFRCADSIPKNLLDRWKKERDDWLRRHPKPRTEKHLREFHRRFTTRIYRWLDQSHGACVLGMPEISHLMETALSFFDGQRYVLDGYVIMPNHVHLILKPLFDQDEGKWRPLEDILHSIKSYTATKINQLCGKKGAFWQKEYFDHILRGSRHLAFFRRYIELNPIKASLAPHQAKVGTGHGLE